MVVSLLCKRKSGEVPPWIDDDSTSYGMEKKARGHGQQFVDSDKSFIPNNYNDPLHAERLKFLQQCGCQTLPKEHLVGPCGKLTPIWYVPIPYRLFSPPCVPETEPRVPWRLGQC
eukprot:7487613-Pyramimonas_sp.AAC.1